MTKDQQNNRQEHLLQCRAAVAQARDNHDIRSLCLALCDLGAALFQTRVYDQGIEAFDEARQLAASHFDRRFEAQCLDLKAAAFQQIGRYHNAYEVFDEILALADEHDDPDLECSTLISQGQVLITSGEPILALEKLMAAQRLAEILQDPRQKMKVLEVLGNQKIAVAALNDAYACFDQAETFAKQIDDASAICGCLLNKGTIRTWLQQHEQAIPLLTEAAERAQALNNIDAELGTLHYLIQSLREVGDFSRIIPAAQRGITLCQTTGNQEALFSYYQILAIARFQSGQPQQALDTIREAAEQAHESGSREQEILMLLNWGEACMVINQYEQALDVYQRALALSRELGREADEAYLVGRIGVALAESGRIEQAITQHQAALALAQARQLPELEGEQLMMLALAYQDQNQPERACEMCQDALAIFTANDLTADAENARQLLDELTLSHA